MFGPHGIRLQERLRRRAINSPLHLLVKWAGSDWRTGFSEYVHETVLLPKEERGKKFFTIVYIDKKINCFFNQRQVHEITEGINKNKIE